MQYFRNEELKQELYNVDKLTEERLDELLDMFLKDFAGGHERVLEDPGDEAAGAARQLRASWLHQD
jgi:(+)-neomenthol dehydrogenase